MTVNKHDHSTPARFAEERAELHKLVLEKGGTGIKRFFNLDTAAYREGALSEKTKHLLGLVASLVLRCDDCVRYHQLEAFRLGVTDAEFEETMNIGLVVGGSITIPHLRRAFAFWEELTSGREDHDGID